VDGNRPYGRREASIGSTPTVTLWVMPATVPQASCLHSQATRHDGKGVQAGSLRYEAGPGAQASRAALNAGDKSPRSAVEDPPAWPVGQVSSRLSEQLRRPALQRFGACQPCESAGSPKRQTHPRVHEACYPKRTLSASKYALAGWTPLLTPSLITDPLARRPMR